MTTRTLGNGFDTTSFRHSSLAKKALVALTGLVLSGWMLLHAAGVFGVFAGPEVMNRYAALLRSTGLLWVMRVGLALALLAHTWLALTLTHEARRARSQSYRKQSFAAGARASRWMRSSGVVLAAWLVYHVAQMYGPAHHDYVPGDVHHTLVTGLASPLVAVSYVIATLLLGVHLHHGLVSTASSLGASARLRQKIEPLARGFVGLVALLLVAPPLAALGGYWS
ncbi:MAG TPA: hypothetical protein VI197_04490 [Polyangiaceae bacterium]